MNSLGLIHDLQNCGKRFYSCANPHSESSSEIVTALSCRAGCAPRLCELLAAGIPVVANTGSGDVNEIITRDRVGMLVADSSPDAVARSVSDIRTLLADPDLPARCRQAAEEWPSLDEGLRRYEALYCCITTTITRLGVATVAQRTSERPPAEQSPRRGA